MIERRHPGSDAAPPSTLPARERLSIVHLTTFYPPHAFGGDAVQVRRLAAAQARRGHDVTVLYPPAAFSLLNRGRAPGNSDRRSAAGPTVHELRGFGAGFEPLLVQQTGRAVLSRSRLRDLLERPREPGPDVIHYHNVSLAGGVGAFGLGSAVKLYTPHEYWLACPTHLLFRYDREPCARKTCIRCTLRKGRPPQLWRYTGLRDRLLAEVDRMIFPSELTRSVLGDHGIVGPGVVMHHFLPDDYVAAAAARGGRRGQAEPYFLYAGRLDAVKGIDWLLEQFATTAPPAPLRVAGEGPLGRHLRRRHGDAPAIRFLGSCDQEALGELYRDALALILPSAGYEVFGLVVAEAFAHGTPAIVSNVGGAAELIRASGGGAVYDTADELHAALERLSRDPQLRAELGSRGRSYARAELDETVYLQRYEELVRTTRNR